MSVVHALRAIAQITSNIGTSGTAATVSSSARGVF